MHKETKLSINPDELSPVALEVWDWLDEASRENIQKKNPFIIIRNKEILKLRQMGVDGLIIAEISGLSSTTISRITKGVKPESDPQNPEMIIKSDVSSTLNEMVMLLKDLNQGLSEIKTVIQSNQEVFNE